MYQSSSSYLEVIFAVIAVSEVWIRQILQILSTLQSSKLQNTNSKKC